MLLRVLWESYSLPSATVADHCLNLRITTSTFCALHHDSVKDVTRLAHAHGQKSLQRAVMVSGVPYGLPGACDHQPTKTVAIVQDRSGARRTLLPRRCALHGLRGESYQNLHSTSILAMMVTRTTSAVGPRSHTPQTSMFVHGAVMILTDSSIFAVRVGCRPIYGATAFVCVPYQGGATGSIHPALYVVDEDSTTSRPRGS